MAVTRPFMAQPSDCPPPPASTREGLGASPLSQRGVKCSPCLETLSSSSMLATHVGPCLTKEGGRQGAFTLLSMLVYRLASLLSACDRWPGGGEWLDEGYQLARDKVASSTQPTLSPYLSLYPTPPHTHTPLLPRTVSPTASLGVYRPCPAYPAVGVVDP
jgi:hypothetical protein